jgi:hypothetical protein
MHSVSCGRASKTRPVMCSLPLTAPDTPLPRLRRQNERQVPEFESLRGPHSKCRTHCYATAREGVEVHFRDGCVTGALPSGGSRSSCDRGAAGRVGRGPPILPLKMRTGRMSNFHASTARISLRPCFRQRTFGGSFAPVADAIGVGACQIGRGAKPTRIIELTKHTKHTV